MRLHQIDPTHDPRWEEFVQKHPKASVFHGVGWLSALRKTYGYEPVVFTTSSPTDELKNGLLFCRVNSWITGRRLVSLPFSDHCEPLCDSSEELNFLIRYLQSALNREEWKYLEFRPTNGCFSQTGEGAGFLPVAKYYLHKLDVRPELDQLFRSFNKDSVQRRVRRANRANLVERHGNSDELLKDFYRLFIITRSRHNLPPIPLVWFRNLIRSMGHALEIRVAYQGQSAVAAILTLRFRDVLYYKYGCSDARLNWLGAMPWLLWRAIAAAKSDGVAEFDMGRTQEGNAGLLAFKSHWAPEPTSLVYWNFPGAPTLDSADGWKLKLAKRIFSCMPDRLLAVTGRLIYRHIG